MYPQSSVSRTASALMLAATLLTATPLSQAQTDIASKPIAGSATVDVKPNIMLLMDTSQSMGFAHMPDGIEGSAVSLPIGYKSSQCNSIYYNPKSTYGLPKGADGVSLPTPDFTAARYNYYSTDTSTVNLSTLFRAFDTSTRSNQSTDANDTAQPAYYYVYSGNQTLVYDRGPCTQPDIGTSGQAISVNADANPGYTNPPGTWTRVIVGSGSGVSPHVDERLNFAIWYTYYRTRMAMAKSSVGLAFAPLTSRFRVGFVTANPGTPVASDKYLAISDFTSANKAAWYAKVNAQVPGGASPMREGLARVGRHYANQHNGINYGMPEDPVQYACQKNYTLMTTDGYWNVGGETAGPVKIDGVTPVGQQDGTLTDDNGNTPYGVWDGGQTSTRVTTNKFNTYTQAACVGGYVNKATAQITQTLRQTLRSTAQDLQTTQQNLETKTQVTQSTNQLRIATSITKRFTTRQDATITEVRKSTLQNLESTSWWEKYTDTLTQTQTQLTRSTAQVLQSTQSMSQSTSQTFQTKQRIDQSTSQISQTVTQAFASTAQALQSTSRQTKSTLQNMQSTARDDQTVTYKTQSTSQLYKYDGSTELSTPTASCTPGGSISCYTVTSGPTRVASCTAATASSSNNYTTTTCTTTTVSGPTAVQTCTPVAASSGNNYQTTSCTAVTSGPTAVATCTNTAEASGNNWTTTSCTSNTTGPTAVASCTSAAAGSGNSYTSTTCTPITTGPTGVSSCTPISPTSANNYTTTTCATNNTGPTAVSSCSPVTGSSGNAWVTTTCSNANSGPTFVASCAAQTGSSANSWKTIACSTATTGPTPVASCTSQAAASGNNYVATTCNTVVTSASTAVASCSPVSPTGPGYVATLCNTVTSGPANVLYSSCTNNDGSASPYIRVVCTPTNTTNVPVSACTSDPGTASPFVKTTCTPVNSGPTDVSSCTASAGTSGNSWVTTSCGSRTVSGPTVMACTVGSTTNGSGLTTTCVKTTSGVTNVLAGSCTPGATTVGGVTTYCTNRTTTNVPVLSCTVNAGTTSPYVTRTCPTPLTTGPTLVDSCTPVTATGPQWIATTCATTTVSGPTPVASCSAGTNTTTHQTTACATVTSGPTAVDPATCSPISPIASNSYTTTTCPLTTTGPTGTQTCSPIAPTSGNGWKTTTCPTNNTGPTLVASCSAAAGTSTNSWVTTTCNPTTLSGPTPVATCTAAAAVSPNWITTSCSVNNTTSVPVDTCVASSKTSPSFTLVTCASATTGPTAVDPATCTASSAGTAPNYIDITCTPTTAASLVASCNLTENNVAPYVQTRCSTLVTPPDLVSSGSCSAATATSPNFISTTCTPVAGSKWQVATTTEVKTEYLSGTNVITTSNSAPSTTAAADVDGMCYTPGIAPPMPLAPATQPAFTGSCTAWPCKVDSPNVLGGSSNALADVSQYYYVTDLRPDFDDQPVALGSKPLDDRASGQHMTTFALGLGVSGTLTYDANYMTSTTGDFARIRPPVAIPPDVAQAATLNWPAWPDPTLDYADQRLYNNAKSIDDFWHAAVNGRGRYFSANDPVAVVNGLGAALSSIASKAGAGGAATVTNPAPVVGSNLAFVTSFKTQEWSGDVTAQRIDVLTGQVSTNTEWSAQLSLDATTAAACDNRKIYIRRAGGTNNLVNFSWNTKGCSNGLPTGTADTGLNAAEQALFGASAVLGLSQYAAMTDGSNGSVDQRTLAKDANLVNYLRGQRGLEVAAESFTVETANTNTVYRKRVHVMGDIVGSVSAFVGAPSASYIDSGYNTFKTDNATRTPMVYVGANDGMLHAIYAPLVSTDPNFSKAGSEAWAYVPKAVMPDLFRLADTDYQASHRYFVDGSPTTADVYDSANASWKTILVGGLNAGGKGYYALDVSDPTSPKSLWEFNQSTTCYNPSDSATTGTDCHLGLTFGRPIISKLVDGTWVVMVASGYNNVRDTAGTGDGQGYLYVLNAMTGQIISKLGTGAGTTGSPSGLRELNNYVANGALDNTTLRVYGGDLLGNIWRFDVNDNITPSGKEATLVATAKDANGTPQPITTRLQLAEVDGKTMIVAATGQFLGTSDTTTIGVQSVYGFTDVVGANLVYADLRGSLRHIALSELDLSRRATSCVGGATNCALTTGWVLDLPETSERVNVDPFIVAGTLTFTSNVPSNSACQAGGHSWLNFVDLITGMAVASSADGVASMYLNDSLSVGVGYVVLADGRVIAINIGSDATVTQKEIPVEPPNPIGRRVSWREIKR